MLPNLGFRQIYFVGFNLFHCCLLAPETYETAPVLNSEKIERRTLQRRTVSIERRILMTLRFIYFKTSEPQPATSSSRRARGLSLSKATKSNFEGYIHFAQSFF